MRSPKSLSGSRLASLPPTNLESTCSAGMAVASRISAPTARPSLTGFSVPSIIVDAGPLIALFDRDDHHHRRALEFIRGRRLRLITNPAGPHRGDIPAAVFRRRTARPA